MCVSIAIVFLVDPHCWHHGETVGTLLWHAEVPLLVSLNQSLRSASCVRCVSAALAQLVSCASATWASAPHCGLVQWRGEC
jgi:hypothetical protein